MATHIKPRINFPNTNQQQQQNKQQHIDRDVEHILKKNDFSSFKIDDTIKTEEEKSLGTSRKKWLIIAVVISFIIIILIIVYYFIYVKNDNKEDLNKKLLSQQNQIHEKDKQIQQLYNNIKQMSYKDNKIYMPPNNRTEPPQQPQQREPKQREPQQREPQQREQKTTQKKQKNIDDSKLPIIEEISDDEDNTDFTKITEDDMDKQISVIFCKTLESNIDTDSKEDNVD